MSVLDTWKVGLRVADAPLAVDARGCVTDLGRPATNDDRCHQVWSYRKRFSISCVGSAIGAVPVVRRSK